MKRDKRNLLFALPHGRVAPLWMTALLCLGTAAQLQGQELGLEREPDDAIGRLEGPEHEVFGRIMDLAVDEDGNLFILDAQAREIRWFDRDGMFRGRAGGRGEGPEEFLSPVRVDVDRSGYVHVLDGQRARIAKFGFDEGDLRLEREIRTMVGAFDFCVVAGRMFVLAFLPDSPDVLYEIDASGEVIRAFGPSVEVDPETVQALQPGQRNAEHLRWQVNAGSITCDAESESLYVVHERSPLVRRFSFSGELIWSTVLEEYRAMHWEPSDGGGVRVAVHPESGTAHTTQAVALAPGGALLVSLHEGSMDDASLEVRRLRAGDGVELGRLSSRSTVMAATRDAIYGRSEELWPRVVVYR